MGWQEQFMVDGAEAVKNFRVVASVVLGPSRWIVAEADTGSRYVMLAQHVGKAAWLFGAPWVVTVHQPWERTYAVQESGFMAVTYFAEKLGRPGARLSDLHGGDVFALMMCLQRLLPDMEIETPFPAGEAG